MCTPMPQSKARVFKFDIPVGERDSIPGEENIEDSDEDQPVPKQQSKPKKVEQGAQTDEVEDKPLPPNNNSDEVQKLENER